MANLSTGFEALRALPRMELAPLVGIPVAYVCGFLVFMVRCAIYGMPRTPRIEKAGSKVIPRATEDYMYWAFGLPVRVLMKLRATPDLVTYLSLPFALLSGVMYATGRFSAGGWILLVSIACDGIDGMLARALGTSSDRGEYLDAVVDRYADFLPAFGLLYYYRNDTVGVLIVMAAIAGSQVMGYAKAKGEAVGIDPKVGWMQRHERAAYLICFTALAPIAGAFIEPFAAHPRYHLALGALALIAFFSNLTAVARAAYVLRRMPVATPALTSLATPRRAAEPRGEPQPRGHYAQSEDAA